MPRAFVDVFMIVLSKESMRLIAPEDWRCVFLMDEAGNHKRVNGYKQLYMRVKLTK